MKAMPDLKSGACKDMDTDLFFGQLNKAQEVACASCPVWQECCDYAMATDVQGIWAGLTVHTRRAIRFKHGIVPAPVGGDEYIGFLRPQKTQEEDVVDR